MRDPPTLTRARYSARFLDLAQTARGGPPLASDVTERASAMSSSGISWPSAWSWMTAAPMYFVVQSTMALRTGRAHRAGLI
ncbi:hypothetical protein ADK52_20095 [Streptomyces sp. WM6372]|nr:hypothetical protein ADK52_20095 [Streptomyces sp. WM6372]